MQRQFIRFLVSKLHLVNSMSDELSSKHVFNQDASIQGSSSVTFDIYSNKNQSKLMTEIDKQTKSP